MRITILDVEWYNRTRHIPNLLCMKLSSYHKQLGDLINFVEEPFHIKATFDIMYVFKEGAMSDLPDNLPLRHENVYLYGEGFKFFDNYLTELPTEIGACRPDYELYDIDKDNIAYELSYAQFYDASGKRFNTIQDYNVSKTKNNIARTIVVDKGFWDKDYEDIKACVERLKNDKSVEFQEPISLTSLCSNAKKLKLLRKLHLRKKSKIQLINDCKDEEQAIKMYCTLLKMTPGVNYCPLHIKALSFNHSENLNRIIDDLTRCLKLINFAKRLKVKIIIDAPSRIDTPLWFYFEDLESWTTTHIRLSYVEFMTLSARFKSHTDDVMYVINDHLKWSTVRIQCLVDVARTYPEVIEKYGYRKWGEDFYPIIDFKKVFKR